jgi:hypothetical protein
VVFDGPWLMANVPVRPVPSAHAVIGGQLQASTASGVAASIASKSR